MKFFPLALLLLFLSSGLLSQSKSSDFSFYFESDVSILKGKELEKLNSVIAIIQYQKIDSIVIQANADSNASLVYNDLLSKRRLNFVTGRINQVFTGINYSRSYFGERKSVNKSVSTYDLSLDRRVDIKVYLKNEMDIKDFYKKYTKTPEVLVVNPNRDTTIETLSGVTLKTRKQSFCTKTNELVELRITKYNSKADIVLNNLNTVTTDNQILESDGMINIEAYQNGKKLCNKLNNSIGISIKTDTIKRGMKLIYGEMDKDSVHKWTWDTPSSSINILDEKQGNGQGGSGGGKRPTCLESWEGCCTISCGGNDSVFSSYYRDSIYVMKYLSENKRNYFEVPFYYGVTTKLQNKKMKWLQSVFWGKKRKNRIRNESFVYLNLRKQDDSLILKNPDFLSLLGKQKKGYEREYSNNFPKSFEINQKTLPLTYVGVEFSFSDRCAKKCGVYDLFTPLVVDSSFLAGLTKMKADCKDVRKYREITKSKRLLKLTNDEILAIKPSELDSYLDRRDSLANSLVDSYLRKEITYNSALAIYTQFPYYLKYRAQSMLDKGEISPTEYVKILPNSSLKDITAYQFRLSRLGLINVDAIKNFDTKRYDLIVKTKTKSCDYKLVFNSIKSVLPAEIIDGDTYSLVFKNVPENQSVSLIGINYIDDELPVQFVKKEFITNAQEELIVVKFGKKISFKKLQEELKSL